MIARIIRALSQPTSLAGIGLLGALCERVSQHGWPNNAVSWTALVASAIGATGAIARDDNSR
jgi:hypothetical protein